MKKHNGLNALLIGAAMIAAVGVGSLVFSAAVGAAPQPAAVDAAPKLPKYVPGTYVLLQSAVRSVPGCNIDKNSLESRLKATVSGHGSVVTPAVLITKPTTLTAAKYGVAIADSWKNQGLPANSVVVVITCDAAQGLQFAAVPNGSLAPGLDVNAWKAAEAAFREQGRKAPQDYAFGVVDYLATNVQKVQLATAAALAARQQVQAQNELNRQVAIAQQEAERQRILAEQEAWRQRALAEQEAQRQQAIVRARQQAQAQRPVIQPPVQATQPAVAADKGKESSGNGAVLVFVLLGGALVVGLIIWLVSRSNRNNGRSGGYASGSTAYSGGSTGGSTGNGPSLSKNTARTPVGGNSVGAGYNRPVDRRVAPTGGALYGSYGFGGQSYPVYQNDVMPYMPSYANQSTFGFWAKNIAAMVAVYGVMEYLFDNGRHDEALAMGYSPSMDRDQWIRRQMSGLDPVNGVDYYHPHVMGDSSFFANPGDFAAQANRNDGWELGTDNTAANPLVAGDGTVDDLRADAAAQENRNDGWELGTDQGTADTSSLAVGDGDQQPAVSADPWGLSAGDGDDQQTTVQNPDNDGNQFAVGDGDEQTDNGNGGSDPYQVSVGDDEPQGNFGSDDQYQVAVGDDDEQAPAGGDDYQFAVGDDEPEEAPESDSYTVDAEPESEPDDTSSDDNNGWE